MLRTIATSTLSLALLCSAPAWAQDEAQRQSGAQSGTSAQQDQQQTGAPAGQGQSSQAGADAKAGAADAEAQTAGASDRAQQDPTQMFVMDTYSSNLFEIKAGELAAQRAQDDQTKQFARQMVKDHTEANQQLKQAAQSKQIQLKEELDAVHQAKLQKLQRVPQQDFGRKYINSQVAGHMMNVLEFRYQSQNLQDAQLKQWAMQMTPKLEQHLQHATQIATKMAGGEAQPAGARESGEGTTGQQPGQRPGQTGSDTGTSGQGTSGQQSGEKSGQSGQSGQSGAGTSGAEGQSGRPGQSE